MTKIATRPSATEVPASDRAVATSHNRPNPSQEAVRQLDEAIDERDGFRQRIAELIGASDRAIAVDQETAGRCADLAKQIAAAIRVVEGEREIVKRPYLEAGRAVDASAKALTLPLQTAGSKVRGKIDTFAREERARFEAERRREEEARLEAERLADEMRRKAEAEGAPAPAPVQATEPSPPAPEPEPIRGDYGGLASVRDVWKHEITDFTLAFIAVEKNEKVREAIDKAIGALVRSGLHEIDGVRIFKDQAVSIR